MRVRDADGACEGGNGDPVLKANETDDGGQQRAAVATNVAGRAG